ncbi:MAG: serine/threonine-protein kinase [Gallionella sp.]|nr:serine/threonine-protein kinase [Gallionella sp.]MDD4945383.1 serine/threonine-protein kinase [Gallionella sp.]
MVENTIPTHLGNYSIVEQIGIGASSNVYLAIESGSYASVAIKQLRKTTQSETYRKLLANEFEFSSKLRHKNIVRPLGADFTEVTGHYLVMEFIRGVSLNQHQYADSLLPINKVLSIIEQIARALEYCASQSIVHRDVKPENIILMYNGMTKLTDFGCAVSTGSGGNMVAGSLAYMSPEQLEGLPLDERADIYSVGALMYRLLTGRNIFDAEDEYEARTAVLNYPAIPIHTHRKELPIELVEIIHRALEKNANDRYSDWKEFITEFVRAAEKIKNSEHEMDIYRGFSASTQTAIYEHLSASRQFSRSVLSRSVMPRE